MTAETQSIAEEKLMLCALGGQMLDGGLSLKTSAVRLFAAAVAAMIANFIDERLAVKEILNILQRRFRNLR